MVRGRPQEESKDQERERERRETSKDQERERERRETRRTRR